MAVEQVKEKVKSEIKEAAKKLIKKFGWGFILEWTPFIGFLVPGDIMLVWRTLGGVKGNLISPEGALMVPIAIFTYVIKLTLGIIEIWFDLGIFTTLITWAIAGFFAAWIFLRGYTPQAQEQKAEKKQSSLTQASEDKKEESSTSENKPKKTESPKTTPKTPSAKK